jgi:uncharacterized protein (TIGR02145 family)/uncharacterized repeat protein (TIGR02543 family)
MKKRIPFSVKALSVVAFAMLHLRCVSDPPNAPQKTKISVVYKSSNAKIFEGSLVDSVGKQMEIGAAIYLPDNFDSLSFKILEGSNITIDTMFRTFNDGYFYDTIWLKRTFWSPGIKNLTITPYVSPVRPAIVASITILGIPQNTPPQWSVDTLKKTIQTGTQLFQALTEICSDAEMDKITFTLIPGAPESDTIIGTTYQFNPKPQNVGSYNVQIKATDPADSFSVLPVKIVVNSSSEDNKPPEITLIFPADTNSTVAVDSCTIDLLCTDPSGVASVSAVLGTITFLSSFKNGHYLIQISGLTKGVTNVVTVKGKDSSALGNTVYKNLYFKYAAAVYSIIYLKGAGVSGAVPVDTGNYESGEQVVVLGNSGSLVKSGYTFIGWNTQEDGNGTAYAGGAAFQIGSASVLLHAQWTTNPTYTVIYNGNGNTSGIVPEDTNKYQTSAQVTIKDNTGLLIRTGSTFTGWNTAADGSGNAYVAGTTFAMANAYVVLYAQWTLKPTFTVEYVGNGNSGGAVPVDVTKYEIASIVTVAPNSGSLVRTGYTLRGWNLQQNGTGKTYVPSDSLLMGTKNVQLYAVWNIDSFTVSFNSNGGSAVVPKIVAYGGYITEPIVPTKAGYVFAGWFSNQSLTTAVDFLTAITISRTLYAKWNPAYMVIYNANGASGQVPVDNNEYQNGQVVTLLDRPAGLSRQYYDFTGWNTASNGSGTNRLPGTTFQIGSKNDTLYANWQIARPSITLQPNALTVYPLEIISFAVTAEGIGLSYQWQKDGTNLPGATNAAFFYNNIYSPTEHQKWGALYNWAVVNTGKLAPPGWHVPSEEEWLALENCLDISRLNIGKSLAAKTDWTVSEDEGGVGNDLTKNNQTGFTGLPGGYRNGLEFLDRYLNGYWWGSTEFTTAIATARALYYNYNGLGYGFGLGLKHYGFSVRLIKD